MEHMLLELPTKENHVVELTIISDSADRLHIYMC
jgi:hypothetical protein